MKRLPYSVGLSRAAGRCNIDQARTPYAAAKEARNDGIKLLTRGDRQYLARTVQGEAAAILKHARSWPLNDGPADQPRDDLQRDAEFSRRVRSTQS